MLIVADQFDALQKNQCLLSEPRFCVTREFVVFLGLSQLKIFSSKDA
jgi:hypothetical protein